MQLATYAIVLLSTITHAYWNYLLKRNGGGSTFVGLSKVAEVVIFAPAFVLFAASAPGRYVSLWPLVVVGAALTLGNYAALARAYRAGDLSVAYPVSRGATLLFLPLLGWLAFGERIAPLGWIAIACVITGIVILNLPALDRSAWRTISRMRRDPALASALVAAFAAACYTAWDKHAVQSLPPFVYFYGYTTLIALAYGAYLLRTVGGGGIRTELRMKWWPIVQVAVLNSGTYLLVLFALRAGTSSYVIAVRQLSVAFGALLGWRLLGESFGIPKRVGVALIVSGCIIVALAG